MPAKKRRTIKVPPAISHERVTLTGRPSKRHTPEWYERLRKRAEALSKRTGKPMPLEEAVMSAQQKEVRRRQWLEEQRRKKAKQRSEELKKARERAERLARHTEATHRVVSGVNVDSDVVVSYRLRKPRLGEVIDEASEALKKDAERRKRKAR
jgi:Trm5-related predicted tRNA methylase